MIPPTLRSPLAAAILLGTTSCVIQPRHDWKPLFNGRDLDGWVQVNCADETFTVTDDGMLYCDGKPTGVLRSEKMYRNFICEFEYKHMVTGGNGGFFVWADALTARGVPFSRSIEVQIIDGWETENWTSHGDVFAIHGARMTPVRPHPAGWERCLPSERRANGTGEWNHFKIIAIDGNIHLAVNGKGVSGGYDIHPRQGYLCIESEGGEVYYRNMRIHELPDDATELPPEWVADEAQGFRSLYNGRDLRGWKAEGDAAEHWRANDWRLSFDGKGQDLWTEESFGDFELIADWRWSGESHEAELPIVLADGSEQRDADGELVLAKVQESGDSGIYLRGSSKSQVNIWCWPIGSGEVYGYRTDGSMSPEVRAGVTPKVAADAPLGQWNRFRIRMEGEYLTVHLNDQLVLDRAHLPGVAAQGPLALQSHGSPIEFANLFIREL